MVRTTRGMIRREEEKIASRPRTTPPLSKEILNNILSNLGQELDRHALATCMRVSSSFNAVSAPLLYRSIRIGDSTAKFDPLYTAPLIDGQSPRKSLDKAACLKLVKELDIVAHSEDDCPLSHFDGPKKVDVLRLSLPLPRKRNTLKPPTTNNHLEYGGQKCPLTAAISAGKVVTFNTSMTQPVHLLDLPQDSLHTLVTAFSYSDIVAEKSRQYRPATKPFKGSTAVSKRAIYILWMRHPQSEIKKRFVNLPSSGYGGVGLKYRRFDELKGMCDPFITDLVKQAMNADFPNDIILVNMGSLDSQRGWGSIPGALDAAEPASWKDSIEREIKATQADNTSTSSKARHKLPEEARKIDITHISMRTYLMEYDWSGVFTEEEVQSWIDSTDIRRGFSDGPRVNGIASIQ